MNSIPHISQYKFTGSSFVLKSKAGLVRSTIAISLSLFALLSPAQSLTGDGHRVHKQIQPSIGLVQNKQPSAPTVDVNVEEHAFVAKATQYMRSVNDRLSSTDARRYAEYIKSAASDQDLDPELLLALIRVESEFRANVVSKNGAKGLAQIIPKYHMAKIIAASDKFAADILHPGLNVTVGAQVLREYIDNSRNLTNALLKYNGSLSDKTQTYAKLVLAEYALVKALVVS